MSPGRRPAFLWGLHCLYGFLLQALAEQVSVLWIWEISPFLQPHLLYFNPVEEARTALLGSESIDQEPLASFDCLTLRFGTSLGVTIGPLSFSSRPLPFLAAVFVL